MPITEYLNSKGFVKFEGYCQLVNQQVDDLIKLTQNGKKRVLEIGFNAGHSAEVFLKNNKELELVSFDLGSHEYVKTAKDFIEMTYPGRHTLILGDSKKTVPQYLEENKNVKFDFIFIDGGHDYETAKADIENCFHFAHDYTIVALDDTMFKSEWMKGWNVGPTKVWQEKIAQKKIIEFERKNYEEGIGMSWGKYIMA